MNSDRNQAFVGLANRNGVSIRDYVNTSGGREIKVSEAAFRIALAQSRSLSAQAKTLSIGIRAEPRLDSVGDQISFLVISGLALEIYLKTFMARARRGKITSGHDLGLLFAQFPAYLQNAFESEFGRRIASVAGVYPIVALTESPDSPETPQGAGPPHKFSTFSETVTSLASCFVTYRYIFEKVEAGSWTYLPFPNQFVIAALDSVEAVFAKYESGEFRGMGAEPGIAT